MRVFDAAARHLSFTRAADELAVTPAAVGQQIRALEDLLGVVLFRRTPKGLELTPEAEAGLPALRAGFLQFEEAVRAMQQGQSSKSLTIAAPRDFTAKWLAPRLAAYGRDDPELRFVLVAGDGDIDFTEANLDLAIRYATDAGDDESVPIGDGTMVTVVAPNAQGGTQMGGTQIQWERDPASGTAGLTVADAGLAIDAAANGFGEARVPLMLAQADIDAGRVTVLGEPQPGKAHYWLVAPLPQWKQKKVKALVDALTRS
jgi:LysR family transcriptional regulator, glycine cleavage system transcriptional activator